MSNRSNVRASLCSFTFADGRQCRTPHADYPYLCVFHARKDAQALAGEEAGKDIAYHLSGSFVSACDLSSALGRLFSAVAQGQMKPKTASTLAYLGQTIVQALQLAQVEYIKALGPNYWRESIRISHQQSIDHFAGNTSPDPESPDPEDEPEPEPDEELASQTAATPASPPDESPVPDQN